MTVFLLHTVPGLVPQLAELAARDGADPDLVHQVDASLLRDTIEQGSPPARVRDKLAAYVRFAHDSRADAVLVTCSSIGEATQAAGQQAGIEVLRIDEPMCREAVGRGRRIGVLATLSSTLEPTTRLLRQAAREHGVDRDIRPELCTGAFDALRAGDVNSHDALVVEGFERLAGQVDVIVLAQASMSRVLDDLPARQVTVPVLSSPESGVAQLRRFAGTRA
jgi:Asp/Glu/hydantoin racemase